LFYSLHPDISLFFLIFHLLGVSTFSNFIAAYVLLTLH
jgi:hypothetical protein